MMGMRTKKMKHSDGSVWDVPENKVQDALASGEMHLVDDAAAPAAAPSKSAVPAPVANAAAAAPKSDEQPWLTTGLVPPDNVAKNLTSMGGLTNNDMSTDELRDWGAVGPKSVDETPAHAAIRTFGGQTAADVGEELSGMTSPLSIATAALGELSRLGSGFSRLARVGRVIGRGARVLNTGTNLGLGVVGAVQAKEGYDKGLDTPEGAREFLRGSAAAVGAAPSAINIASRATDLARGAETPEMQARGISAALPKGKEPVGDVVSRNLQGMRDEFHAQGLDRNQFGEPGSYDKFVGVIDGAIKKLEAQYAPTLQRFGGKKLSGNPIASELETVARTFDKLHPDIAQSIRDRAANYRGKWITLNELNQERQTLNAMNSAFEGKGGLQQSQSLDKNQADSLALKTAADKVRDMLYGELSRRSGVDYTPVKQQESDLITLRELAKKQAPAIENEQDKFMAAGKWGRARGGMESGLSMHSIRAPFSRALLQESPEAEVGRYLKKGFAPDKLPAVSNRAITAGVLTQNEAEANGAPSSPVPAPIARAASAGVSRTPAPIAAAAPKSASPATSQPADKTMSVGQYVRTKDGKRAVIVGFTKDGNVIIDDGE